MREKYKAVETYFKPFIPILSIIFVVGSMLSIFIEASYFRQVSASAQSETMLEAKNFRDEVNYQISDLLYLSDIVRNAHNLTTGNDERFLQTVQSAFSDFSRSNASFDQVRLFGPDGMELVRINWIDGQAHIVPEDELQKKNDRYFFKESQALKSGEVYISGFDLNIEGTQIEQPPKPVYRLITPVDLSDGSRLGYVVLNILGKPVLDRIIETQKIIHGHFYFINQNGDWLIGPPGTTSWGFMYSNAQNSNISTTFPMIWQQYEGEDILQTSDWNGLFTFKLIDPMGNIEGKNNLNIKGTLHEKWILVSQIKVSQLISGTSLFVFLTLLVLLFILYITFYHVAKNRLSEHLALQAKEESDRKLDIISKNSQDAIILIDQSALIQYWSRSAQRLFGYSEEEVLGKEIHGIIAMHQEDREKAYKGMENFAKTGEGPILRILHEVDAKKKDGILFPAEISINAVQIDNEWWAVGIVRDISDRRRSEKEIREMAQFPLEISNAIMRVDDEFTLLFANPASKYLLSNLEMKVGKKVAQPLRDLVGEAIRKNERIETRLEISGRIFLLTAFPIPQSGYVNIYGVDITEEENVRRSVEASELKYRSLVNAMPQYMFHKDLQGRYITVNDALAKLMGVDSARVPGKNDLDFFAKEAAVIHKKSDKEVIENKLPIEFDEPLDPEKPEGNVIHMVKAPIINANGDVEGVLGIFWDITNRIKAERELASLNRNLEALVKDRTREIETINDRLSISEKRYKAIIESQVELVFRWDLQGRITYANPSFSDHYGKKASELEASFYRDVISSEGMDRLYAMMKKLSNEKPLLTTEIRNVLPDGKVSWEQWNSRAIFNEKDEIIEIQNVGRDITPLKRAQEQLSLQSSALEAAANGIVITDRDGNIIWANQALSRLTGYSLVEVTGKNPRIFKSGEMKLELYQNMWDTICAGKVWSGEVINRKKDGSFYDEEMTITPISIGGEEITNFIAIKQDVTLRKAMEDETRRAREQAELANRAKSTFLANMSHEIRTPLNAIMGLNYLLRRTGINDIQQQYLDKMQNASKNLLDTINDVLDFSKIEADKVEIENVAFNLEDVLLDISDTEALKAHQKGIELIISMGEDIPERMEGDPIRLKQVLRNLTNNAVKFTEHGEVVINIEKVEEDQEMVTLRFSVSDTGIGLTQEQIEHLFTPFQQADVSTTRKYGGSGLGLAISKRIVELMGGIISVTSEFGHGSTFTFTLPLKKLPPKKKMDLFLIKELIGKKVLIVDSNSKSSQWLARILKQTQADITQVGDLDTLKEVLDQTRTESPFDAILVNNNVKGFRRMSDLVGIKRQFPHSNVKVIHLTDTIQFAQQTETSSEKTSIDAILIKPISASQLYDTWLSLFGGEHKQDITERTSLRAQQQQELKKKTRVLLVEDNEINQDVIGDLLRQNGAEVEIAGNGKEAIEKLKQRSFDLVLMDVQMPVMDGFKATREIRKDPRFASLPIIALTANAQLEEKNLAQQVGMNDYITKPIEPKLLFSVIAKWTNQSIKTNEEEAPARESKLKIRGLDIDAALRRVNNDEEKLMNLLEKFVQNHTTDFDEMQAQLEQNQWEELRSKAHAIRGAAANLGANELAQILNEVEASAVEKNRSRVEEVLAQAVGTFDVLQKNLSKVSRKRDKVRSKIVLDRKELKVSIEHLLQRVEDHDPTARDLINKISQAIPAGDLADSLTKTKVFLENYDFKKAEVEIKRAIKLLGSE